MNINNLHLFFSLNMGVSEIQFIKYQVNSLLPVYPKLDLRGENRVSPYPDTKIPHNSRQIANLREIRASWIFYQTYFGSKLTVA